MLEELLRHLRNWFVVPGGVHEGTFTIGNGGLDLPFLADGQYFRICGSLFNDGLHRYGESCLTAETFEGTVWALAIPSAVVIMAEEIQAWQDKHGEASSGPYASESFGGYSYTRATDPKTGGAVTWETAFRKRLDPWRRPRELGVAR